MNDFFISPEALGGKIGQPDLVVADGSWYMPAMERDARAEYLDKHISGAIFFDIDAIADTTHAVPHMLPAPEVFAARCGELGISHESEIVVYDGMGLFAAPRLWWTLRVMGAQNVRILTGGLPAWAAAGNDVQAGEIAPVTQNFVPNFDAGRVHDRDDMLQIVDQGEVQILDVRPAGRFSGEALEPRAGVRSGHMPGAKNLPFMKLIEDGQLIAPERIAALLASAGIDMDKPVVTSCGSGLTAAILSLGLEMLGHRDHRLYDASWSEWGADAANPVVTD